MSKSEKSNPKELTITLNPDTFIMSLSILAGSLIIGLFNFFGLNGLTIAESSTPSTVPTVNAFNNGGNDPAPNNGNPYPTEAMGQLPTNVEVEEVTAEDWILGDRNAPVSIIEFSDIECPFCGRVHPTLKQIVEDYDGKVNWVFRHFPLNAIHPNAQSAAEASECAGEQGGNDTFWAFTDTLFERQTNLNNSTYTSVAEELGLNMDQFQDCVSSNKYADKVRNHTTQAQNAGGTGTPYSVIVTSNGDSIPVSGAQPYNQFVATIDPLLN